MGTSGDEDFPHDLARAFAQAVLLPRQSQYRSGKAHIDPDVYPTLDEFWSDLTAAYREEVRRLAESGCTYLQFDDTSLAYLNDPHQRDYIESIGGDHDRQHVEYIHHINEALSGRPPGMSVTTHMCRGNFRSSWAAEGSYDYVAEALLNELEVDGFFMEWDDDALRRVRTAALSAKGRQIRRAGPRDNQERRARIEGCTEASDRGGVDVCAARTAVSVTAVRFSSTVEGNALTEEQQWEKLRLIVDVAEEVWG